MPEDVTALAAGRDSQIERGVEELLRALADNPVVAPPRPAPEDRSRPGSTSTDRTGGGARGTGGG